MPPRLFIDRPLMTAGATFALPAGPARHVQVLRLQPGAALTLFDGAGGESAATVLQMGRSEVTVRLGERTEVDRELPFQVTLALGMPANERMDTLVEKAAELGAAVLRPLHTERSVLRLSGDRAEKRRAHWQSVAIAACEQCGRTRPMRVEPVRNLDAWLAATNTAAAPADAPAAATRWVLAPGAPGPAAMPAGAALLLSGPEGGLTPDERAAAEKAGFLPVGLGPRVLRADTAPLAALAWLALSAP